jgi:hypothetical protein
MKSTTLFACTVPDLVLTGSDREPARFAVDELRRYLATILSSEGAAATSALACRVIDLRVEPDQFDGDEAYAWDAAGDRVALRAGGDLGLLFAVYAFLQEVCGCVFAAPGPAGEFIPRANPLRLQVEPVRRTPRLWYRGIQCYFFEPPELYQQQIDWLTKQGYNYVEYHLAHPGDDKVLREQVDPQTGEPLFPKALGPSAFDEAYFQKHLLPHVRRRGLKLDFNHHNLWFWVPPKEHKAQHAQWFSLVNGQRGANLNQLCLCTSNPQVIEELVRRVREFLRRNPQVTIVGVVPEDGIGMCQCETCLAQDGNRDDAFAPQGDHRTVAGQNQSLINRYARLLNAVAAGIAQEFPHVLVGGSAYVNCTMPPRDLAMAGNLAIQVAVYWRDGARPLAPQGTSVLNQFFFEVIRRWRASLPQPSRLLLYEYYMGMMAQKCLPYPMTQVIDDDWRALASIGVEGASVQCCAGATQSYVLNLTAFGRAAWGLPVEPAALAENYAIGLFGQAAGSLAWIFHRWHEATAALRPLPDQPPQIKDGELDWRSQPVLRPDGSLVRTLWRALGGAGRVQQAIEQARSSADSPRVKQNIATLEGYLGYCRLAAEAMDASARGAELRSSNPAAATQSWHDAVHVHYPALIAYLERTDMPGWVLPRIVPRWKSELAALTRELDQLKAASASVT